MMRRLLLLVFCWLCAVGCAECMGKSNGEEPLQSTRDDAWEKSEIFEGTAFFVGFQGEQLPISRDAIMRSSLLFYMVSTWVDETKSSFIVPWGLVEIGKLGKNGFYKLSLDEIKTFLSILEKKPDYKQLTPHSLCVQLNCANYALMSAFPDGYKPDRDVFEELLQELSSRVSTLTDADYFQFLNGAGILKTMVNLVPDDVLAELKICLLHGREPEIIQCGDAWRFLELADGRLAVGTRYGQVKIFDVKNPQKLPVILKGGGNDGIDAMLQLGDGRLMTGSAHGNIIVWDLEKNKKLFEWKGLESVIVDLKELQPGKVLTLYFDHRAQLWDLNLSEPAKTPQDPDLQVTSLLVLSSDQIVYGGEGGFWISVSPDDELSWFPIQNGIVFALAELPDKRLAVGSQFGAITIVDGGHLDRPGITLQKTLDYNDLVIYMTKCNAHSLVSITNSGDIRVWDIEHLTQKPVVLHQGVKFHDAFKSHEEKLVVAQADGVRIWDTRSFGRPPILLKLNGCPWCVRELRGGRIAVLIGALPNKRVEIYESYPDLSFEQSVLIEALMRLKRAKPKFLVKVWNTLKECFARGSSCNKTFSYEKIMSDPATLELFISCPIQSLRMLAQAGGSDIIRAAVEQLIKTVKSDDQDKLQQEKNSAERLKQVKRLMEEALGLSGNALKNDPLAKRLNALQTQKMPREANGPTKSLNFEEKKKQ
jgi:WD40 repeat protein